MNLSQVAMICRYLHRLNPGLPAWFITRTATKICPVIIEWGKEVTQQLEPVLANENIDSSDNV